MNAPDILKLANWSEPKEVQTKNGPRILRKAEPTDTFSSAWKVHKDEIKSLGAGFGRDMYGNWELTWWQELSAEIQNKRKESIEASRATSAEIELPHPPGLDYMPFQKAGIRYALDRKGVLFGDEMGLGKTIQAIGVINADPEIKTAIIVCPKSLKLNWKRELEKWLTRPLTIGVANGDYPDTDIVILNYESLGKYMPRITERSWGICVLDEAHFIKNQKAQRSQKAKMIKANRKLRLTGTPIVNRPAELYNIIEDLGGSWGSFFSFAKRYCNAHNNGYGWDFSGAANLDELQRRLRETIMVRRLKSEVLTELPRKIRQIVEVEAENGAKQAVKTEQAYETASDERLASLRAQVELSKAESEEAYKTAVESLRNAQQIDFTEMSRLRHETAVAKVPAVLAHVENLMEDNNGYKVILAAHHHDVIDQLRTGLAEYQPVILTGESSEQERQQAVDDFQNKHDVKVFIGSITAAGVGITLTASAHVIFAELDWVPGNVSQMEDRAHRIGQTETVLVQHIVLQDSLDCRMAHLLVKKQAIIDSALDTHHPDRTRPAYESKQVAASHAETVDKLAEVAATLTAEQIAEIHTKLRFLAGMDEDHASSLNGIGYNKIDTCIGHDLANRANLTSRQAALGQKILAKYRRQFGE